MQLLMSVYPDIAQEGKVYYVIMWIEQQPKVFMNSPTSYHNSEYRWQRHSSFLLYPYIIHIKASTVGYKLINSYKDNRCCIKFSYSPYVCLYAHNHTSMCNTYMLAILIG